MAFKLILILVSLTSRSARNIIEGIELKKLIDLLLST